MELTDPVRGMLLMVRHLENAEDAALIGQVPASQGQHQKMSLCTTASHWLLLKEEIDKRKKYLREWSIKFEVRLTSCLKNLQWPMRSWCFATTFSPKKKKKRIKLWFGEKGAFQSTLF